MDSDQSHKSYQNIERRNEQTKGDGFAKRLLDAAFKLTTGTIERFILPQLAGNPQKSTQIRSMNC